MTSEFTVEFAPHGKAIVYREDQRTYAFESATRGKRVEVDFGHCYDPSSFGGGSYDYGSTTTEEQRRIAPRVIHWLQSAGYEVDAAGQHDDRWLPSYYKK
jgi:hypothetical protein